MGPVAQPSKLFSGGTLQLLVPFKRKDAKLGGAQTARDLNLLNLEVKA
jgi:hypothetical protein